VGTKGVKALVKVHVTVIIGVAIVRLAVIRGDVVVLIAVIGLVMRGVMNTVRVKSTLSIFVVAFIGMAVSVALAVGRAVTFAMTVNVAFTVSPGITVGVAVALTLRSTVVSVLRLLVMDMLIMALVFVVTSGLVVVRGNVSIVMGAEVNLRVGLVKLLVVPNSPELLRHIGNGMAIKAGNFAVLSPEALATDMSEAVRVDADAVETVVVLVTLAATLAMTVAMFFVSHVVTNEVSDTGLAMLDTTNGFMEVLVGAGTTKVLLSGLGLMLIVVELSEFLLMDRVEVLALIMAMDGKLYSLDMIVAHLNSLALWVNVAMLVVVLRLSDGNDHAIVKVFSMLMRISGFRHFYYYNFSRLMRDGLVVSVVALVFKIVVVLVVLIVRVRKSIF